MKRKNMIPSGFNLDEWEAFRKEWNKTRKPFLMVEWVKKYKKGVKVLGDW